MRIFNARAFGLIPLWLDEDAPGTLLEQINRGYAHGGGWQPFAGFTVRGSLTAGFVLTYPGDPPLRELGRLMFRDNFLVAFPHAWFLAVHADGTTSVARLD